MRVIVFGATGKTGQHVCKAAQDAGHQVTAFGRSVDKLDTPGLELCKGDVFDAGSVTGALARHDAVIVCLGSTSLRDKTTLSAGTKNIVDAAVDHGVKRLVVMSAAGVEDSWKQIPWTSKLMFRTMLRNLFAEHHAQESVVKNSPLDWTIVRAAVLKDAPATGTFTSTNTGPITRINREDVAAALVQQLDETTHSCQAISVTS